MPSCDLPYTEVCNGNSFCGSSPSIRSCILGCEGSDCTRCSCRITRTPHTVRAAGTTLGFHIGGARTLSPSVFLCGPYPLRVLTRPARVASGGRAGTSVKGSSKPPSALRPHSSTILGESCGLPAPGLVFHFASSADRRDRARHRRSSRWCCAKSRLLSSRFSEPPARTV